MDLTHGLNPAQQEAVTAGEGPVLVLAGPGSGKTRVLTHRIAYLIGYMGTRPYQILAVTFTNRAAREMEHRVENMLGDSARGMTLGTFHSICARILRREAESLPFQSNFVIFDSDDQLSLVKRAVAELNIDEKRNRPASFHAAISTAKNELVLPENYPSGNFRQEMVKRVYQKYQDLLLANNALDFDDLLLWTAHLLENNREVRERYAARYVHVLVDEFQDTNLAQYTLLKHLASTHRNIFAVGDVDQAIYRWRGADYRNVLRFEEDYTDTRVILLEQNYRSTQAILDVAMAVIDRNPYRAPKRLFTDRGQGVRVYLHETEDDRVEAAFIVNKIAEMVALKEAGPGDFAVMYRTNAQSRLVEEAFLSAGLKYKLVGAQRFYGRREVKDVIAFLRLVFNPSDEISLSRVINVPPRGIGDKTLQGLRTLAGHHSMPPGKLLQAVGRGETISGMEAFSGRPGTSLAAFGSRLAGWMAVKDDLAPLELMDRILDDVDYHNHIDDGSDEGHDRWENVMELRRLASEFKEAGLQSFLEQVALVSDQDTLAESGSVPTLLTLHAAKGLEFPIVFIAGLNDGVLPHMRSFDEPEAMMEERRLFYVGITRARDRLYLLQSQNRSSFGSDEPAIPSRFLDDIPANLLESSQRRRRRDDGYRSERLPYRADRWDATEAPPPPSRPQQRTPQRPGSRPSTGAPSGASSGPSSRPPARPAPSTPVEKRYSPGMKVLHPTWGEGMVLNSRVQSDDEVVDIFFESVGLKRVAASIAPLEIKT